jgi:hypothetical protein
VSAVNGRLRIVKGNGLVEQVDRAVLRVEVAHRLGVGLRFAQVRILDPLFIKTGATQKAGFVIVMVLDHFQHQGTDFILMTHEGE